MAELKTAKVESSPDRKSDVAAPDLGLVSSGKPFESFPGAVLVVGHNGLVLTANDAADPIAKLLQRGAPPELHDAINSALDGKAAQVNPLLMSDGAADQVRVQAFDLMALPWIDAPAALLLGREITLERSLRAALIESRQRYKDLVEASSDFAWETDEEGRFTFISSSHALGYLAHELIGRDAATLLSGEADRQAAPFTTRVPLDGVPVWMRGHDGYVSCLSVIALPLTGVDGKWHGVRGMCRDITEHATREAELATARHRERLFAHILKSMRDESEPARVLNAIAEQLIPALGLSGVYICRAAGAGTLTPDAKAGAPVPDALLEAALAKIRDGEPQVEQRGDAGCLVVRATLYRERCNGALCLWSQDADQAWGRDEAFILEEIAAQVAVVNEQLDRQRTLERLSSTDALTGLHNRRSFMSALGQRFADCQARNASLCLFYLDLDNFKPVNDRFGHQRGDEVLTIASRMLRKHVREGDVISRLGGDEFGMVIEGLDAQEALRKGEALVGEIADLSEHSVDRDHPLGVSIGIAVYDPSHPESLDSLVSRADHAMYAVKHGGKSGVMLAPPPRADGDT